MTVRALALAVAISKVGQAEVGGPNQGPIVDWAIAPWTKSHAGPWALWCAAFVSTCMLEAGAPPEWHDVGSTSCTTLWTRCHSRGWAQPIADAQPGDLVFFGVAGDLAHVGLVDHLDARTLYTVEGNAGNAVRRRTYDLSNPRLCGLARVPW